MCQAGPACTVGLRKSRGWLVLPWAPGLPSASLRCQEQGLALSGAFLHRHVPHLRRGVAGLPKVYAEGEGPQTVSPSPPPAFPLGHLPVTCPSPSCRLSYLLSSCTVPMRVPTPLAAGATFQRVASLLRPTQSRAQSSPNPHAPGLRVSCPFHGKIQIPAERGFLTHSLPPALGHCRPGGQDEAEISAIREPLAEARGQPARIQGPGREEQLDDPQAEGRRAPGGTGRGPGVQAGLETKPKAATEERHQTQEPGATPRPPFPPAGPHAVRRRPDARLSPLGAAVESPQSDGTAGWWCLRALPAPNASPALGPGVDEAGPAPVALRTCPWFLPLASQPHSKLVCKVGCLQSIHYFQPRSGSRWTGQPLTLSLPPQAPPPPNAPKAPGHAGLCAHCLPSHPLFRSAISEATCSLRLLGSPTSFRVPARRWNQDLSDLDRPLAKPLRAHGDCLALHRATPGRARVRICDKSLRKKEQACEREKA